MKFYFINWRGCRASSALETSGKVRWGGLESVEHGVSVGGMEFDENS